MKILVIVDAPRSGGKLLALARDNQPDVTTNGDGSIRARAPIASADSAHGRQTPSPRRAS